MTNPPSKPEGGSQWAGMSGAALRAADMVVGVVTKDPKGFDSRRLVTMPITAVTTDPGFAGIVAAHTGAAPVVEAVELAGLGEPVSTPVSPAELLRADAATAPFRSRPELGLLWDWCQADAWFGVRLVAGAGGQGKTRLARHLVAQLSAQGWAAVMLGEHTRTADVAVLSEVAVPTLVVLDYAEGRTAQLDPVIAAMNRAHEKVRLLLLARTAGAWRTERVTPAAHLGVLADDRIVVNLGPVEPERGGRERAWRQAVDALAARLGDLDAYRDIPWPRLAAGLAGPPLGDERFRTILAVQMDALAALLQAGDPIPGGARDAREVLLEHEDRYWSRVAARFDIALSPATRRCLVATATLWGATTRVDAHRVLGCALGATAPDVVGDVADWLATLYQDSDRFWSGLQPDPLAEYLIGTTVGPDSRCPGLVTDPLAQASPGQLEHALTILGRAHPQHPHLVEAITDMVVSSGPAGVAAVVAVAPRPAQPQPLLTALNRLVDTAEITELSALNDALPRFSLLLGPTTLNANVRTVELLRAAAATSRDVYLPALAGSVNNLAIRLAEAGRRGEGLAAAQEAVTLYRELAEGNRDAYLANLAMSVNNLALRLAEAGRRGEGLTAAQEAVTLLRELVEGNRDAYLPDLAGAVNNLALRLAEAGRRAEGLTAAQEALTLYRELAQSEPDMYGLRVERAEALTASLLENEA
ncbi:MAG: tetratricopeptide repeat protein [Pseudonocardia sp.]